MSHNLKRARRFLAQALRRIDEIPDETRININAALSALEPSSNPHKSTDHAEFYHHIRAMSVHGKRTYKAGTVYFRRLRGNDDPGASYWLVGVARCDERDNFSRAKGRQNARARALKSRRDAGLYNSHFTFELATGQKPSYELARLFYVSQDSASAKQVVNACITLGKPVHVPAKALAQALPNARGLD